MAAEQNEPRVLVHSISVVWFFSFERVCVISFCLEILKCVHTDVITANSSELHYLGLCIHGERV